MIASEFTQRRQQLMEQVGKGNIAIIASAMIRTRNRDVDYPFRQDSEFYYLTGFNEANALAVFIPGRKQGEYILFCQEFDEKKALWEGAHAGLEGATREYGADDSFPIDDLGDILPGLLENKSKVFYPMGRDSDLDHQLMEWITHIRSQTRSGINAPGELVSLEHTLHEMRLIKSPAEIALMQKAADVSAKAHVRAMQRCQAGRYEYQIEGEMIHEFIDNGLRAVAYPSIVAGGENACVLHYTENKAVLKSGDLLLIDAGAECDHYAADITRTFPVNGVFSIEQKLLYQLVLDAQLAAMQEIKVDTPWNKAHEASVEVLTTGLVELGLLTGDVQTIIAEEGYKVFYMHRIGHWLGMDVHDVGDYKINDEWRVLESGMVLTIEPGLYIPADCATVDEKWRGIGIRIEDDVLVTEQGYQILSHAVPKTIAEIEAIMQE
ncbi:Xaa-Pro aminopeptidase [Bathymodiolus platifrons methanotrophic gill symbiont]|uniref:aminopeptidase P N-terminal domain-containing protein n=2 Tax=Bathymodiolus platifrons methanotrophic gill symbiont TaxID=113268 RepID=UPI000B40B86C|nr:aminopeptidase P N-terminal domain-containing protein [Bathymodiolus platifrons methanotrophic gill symbiont]MCK5870848.1 aminopeptidase P N-terminal domain-containing protein [Methyloprofundus sp.]TXK93891.1 Xaa-Pro aminopeptidase [Methylococcaceae bacterium CS4]TXK98518.1 Xaa-Pro aminopeptidase [Methylococcaceae bacterium CS5]TXL02044.1 Xaa-Pro aminopeptidase [Methylococcaceae bacterium HT1]TXL05577.1 Xaa-Pro aminopeptidase [Methylococcaceae bacterium CS1]TXL09479.1 Xaa-Pro aminopeptidas